MDDTINPLEIVKPLRTLIRTHRTTLDRLNSEHLLLQRIWYKSRSQFRSSLWFQHYNGLRRSLRTLLSLLTSLLRNCIDAFCTLFNERADGRDSLPKYFQPPTNLNPDRTVWRQAAQSISNYKEGVGVVKRRARSAYRVAEKHLRTPPVGSFAPVVTAVLVLSAGVEGLLEGELGEVYDILAKVANRREVGKRMSKRRRVQLRKRCVPASLDEKQEEIPNEAPQPQVSSITADDDLGETIAR